MAACAGCGAENPDTAKFCAECGAPLSAAEAPEQFRKTVTILFSDVVGSTALGERLDPETLSQLMTEARRTRQYGSPTRGPRSWRRRRS